MTKAFNPRDPYAQKATKEGYLARSAYKLEGIIKEFKIEMQGKKILDLGAAPGSWMQISSKKAGEKGIVVGIDVSPILANGKNIIKLPMDVFDKKAEDNLIKYAPFDIILSDMAPKTSGIKIQDQAKSEELVFRALNLSEKLLKKNGSIIIKVFEGPGLYSIRKIIEKHFKKTRVHKPKASRDRSFETYIIGIGKIDESE
jgi:23S rRNA (uridine2552-2'-O)-methyltransferase